MTMNAGNGEVERHITIEELLQRIEAACDGMSEHNPNRLLLQQCRVAIIYLAQRVPDAALQQRSGLVLP
jgi:hypothetical protein